MQDFVFVIPGRAEGADPESRHTNTNDVAGFQVRSLRERPGMTTFESARRE